MTQPGGRFSLTARVLLTSTASGGKVKQAAFYKSVSLRYHQVGLARKGETSGGLSNGSANPESVVMTVHTIRTREKLCNRWGQIGISACVLMLPPIALGGAAIAMLTPPNEIATRDALPAAKTIAMSLAAEAVAAFDAAPAQAALTPPATLPQATQPAARNGAGPMAGQQKVTAQNAGEQRGAMADPSSGGAGAYSLASAGQDRPVQPLQSVQSPQPPPASPSGKDMARLMGPVPVRVTVVVAPNASHEAMLPEPPAPAPAATPSEPLPAPASPAVPPASAALPAEVPPVAAVAPVPPTAFAAEGPAETRTRRSVRPASHTAAASQPPHRNAEHEETRSARPARATRQTPYPADVLRDLLDQLGGSRPRTGQRG